MPSAENIAGLIFKFLRNEVSEAEKLALTEWRAASPENEERFRRLTGTEQIREMMSDYYSTKEKAWAKLLELAPELKPVVRPMSTPIWRTVIAAAVIAAVSAIAIMLLKKSPAPTVATIPATSITTDIAAGTSKAILTLSNGAQVMLGMPDHKIDQEKTEQNHIATLDEKGIAYATANKKTEPQTLYNTLATPRAGQYQVTLSDGSRVWLNAASSIKYPVAFTGNERRVEITGEVYFEVAKDALRPFRVVVLSAAPALVEVLGTHFNINAYADEPSGTTTLLEGRVKFTTSASVILSPGEQAKNNYALNKIAVLKNVDTTGIVAWKNGRTLFKDADIKSIMRMIARWYDVEIDYEGTPQARSITGGISRNAPLSELLKVLALNNIHFSMEGKTIVVKP